MTEKTNTCVEILRKAAHTSASFDCRYCPAYNTCPTGTAGWNNECIFETAADLIESFSAELERTENKLSELLYYVTGGRFSKVGYSTDDMRRFVDDYCQSVCDECDELEQVKAERDGLNVLLGQAQSMLETRTRERDAVVKDLEFFAACQFCKHYEENTCTGECTVPGAKTHWQWRGVQEHGVGATNETH